ncbi:hypothetical protein ACSU1N_05825 [Thermogladius sp. 4427co]|uniref:hypothetical protein n=1 Tax=Thermogladius sp. 4427co TaxID=3450718 RepID=UPI003F7ADC33
MIIKTFVVERAIELLDQMNMYYLRALEDIIEKESEVMSENESGDEVGEVREIFELAKRIIAEELNVEYAPILMSILNKGVANSSVEAGEENS